MRGVISRGLAIAAAGVLCAGAALAQDSTAYDSIPSPVPPNVVSLGFQCCATSEFGDEIGLQAGTGRRAGFVTVLMSDWAKHSDYPAMPAAGFTHTITFNLYLDAASALAHSPVKTVSQSFLIPWRPEHDPSCAGDGWKAADGQCYNGYAFPITFDLRSLNYDLPNQLIFGIAYNTNTWGYQPIGQPGPYESLNVGLNGTPPVAVGTDIDTDAVYWNTSYAPFYSDGGAGGVGTFRPDTAWAPYTPAVRFTTFTLATSAAGCKNGGWKNLVRADYTAFKNQGDCVSYTNTGR